MRPRGRSPKTAPPPPAELGTGKEEGLVARGARMQYLAERAVVS